MARMEKIGKVATKIRTEGGKTIVRYHATDVVAFDGKIVTLNSGGYRTRTTKVRMNQTANQYNPPFEVFQRQGEWIVSLSNGGLLPFYDGMTFELEAAEVA